MPSKFKLNTDISTKIRTPSDKERLAEAIEAGDRKAARQAFIRMNDVQLNRVRMLVETLSEDMSFAQKGAAANCLFDLAAKDLTNILNSPTYDSWQKKALIEVLRRDRELPQMVKNSLFISLQSHRKLYPKCGDALTKNWLAPYIQDNYETSKSSLGMYLLMYSERMYGEYENAVSTFLCRLIRSQEGNTKDAIESTLRDAAIRRAMKYKALIALKNKDGALARTYAEILIDRNARFNTSVDLGTLDLARTLLG